VISGVALLVATALWKGCLDLANPVVESVVFWAWWVIVLYLAMVALRSLGLFCFRARVVSVGRTRRR